VHHYKENDDAPDEISEKIFRSFAEAAAQFKHRGFREEREVRIVSFVQTQKHFESMYEKYGKTPPQSYCHKKIHCIGGVERILLFESNDTKQLPIKRIIVGPHKEQDKLVAKVNEITRGATRVTQSETSFIG